MSHAPIPKPHNRLIGLDLARYLAFVGMVIVNFKTVMVTKDAGGLLAMLTSGLEGRAAASFVVLAGIGLGLSASRAPDHTVMVTLKRALFLLGVGLLNMSIFEADIIHYYAFYFLFGVAFLRPSSRTLLWSVLGLNLLFVGMVLTLDYDAGWNWDDLSYSGFWTVTGFVRNLLFNGWHPVIPWLSFLLIGIALSRMELGVKRTQVRLILSGAIAIACAEGMSAVLTQQMGTTDPDLLLLVTTDPIPPMPLYVLAGIGAACMVIGGCLLMSDQLYTLGVLQFVTPAGRQTLTLYIAHIIIGMGLLDAFGRLGGQTVAEAVWAAVAFCLIATVFAWLWAKKFKRGPIETVMRSIAG